MTILLLFIEFLSLFTSFQKNEFETISPPIGVHFLEIISDRLQILVVVLAVKTRALNHSTTPPGKNY